MLNISMIVGAGVFVTIPLMLGKLPGPYALLGWLVAGGLMLVDGLIFDVHDAGVASCIDARTGNRHPDRGDTWLRTLPC